MTGALPKKVCLGLQGAGTYGAYTWGVLDRLLDDERFLIDSLSGSSSGAVNAVVLADGYARGGGRRGAQQALRRFWTALGQAFMFTPLQRTPLDHWAGGWTMEFSPAYQMLEMAGALIGPVPETPLSQNPLRKLLAALIDFERVRACEELQLFVAATNVRTGAGRIFMREELDVQKVLASACLPTVFAAVEVDGEAYWDGSYIANPPLAPFLQRDGADMIIVRNNPVARAQAPRTMADIGNRSNEIAFNTSYLRELNALPQALPRRHLISGVELLSGYSVSSKLNGEPAFLQHLYQHGHTAADNWLAQHGDAVGIASTL
ncbi:MULTISPECIES: patatin-like phospholipase family protein [unclassified Duganella]|uniref:patatin-like phospholipase family protein n=1 Tax=unclassified Duganella TaxID=2636909 RepID=UPI00089062C0|nr:MULTISPECIES: patatin-like phospholipase family protein [unclassified Duganella]SDG15061.1 NTE family protein [Duganella sp. OV458]SDJ32950.1 NTE family protein [Duganella sp. OV510]